MPCKAASPSRASSLPRPVPCKHSTVFSLSPRRMRLNFWYLPRHRVPSLRQQTERERNSFFGVRRGEQGVGYVVSSRFEGRRWIFLWKLLSFFFFFFVFSFLRARDWFNRDLRWIAKHKWELHWMFINGDNPETLKRIFSINHQLWCLVAFGKIFDTLKSYISSLQVSLLPTRMNGWNLHFLKCVLSCIISRLSSLYC